MMLIRMLAAVVMLIARQRVLARLVVMVKPVLNLRLAMMVMPMLAAVVMPIVLKLVLAPPVVTATNVLS